MVTGGVALIVKGGARISAETSYRTWKYMKLEYNSVDFFWGLQTIIFISGLQIFFSFLE